MGFDFGTLRGTKNVLLTSDHTSVVSISLFVTLLCACIVIGHLLEEHRWINESITALLIGVGTGVVILLISGGKSSHLLVFSEDLFFFYLLPPIIFNAGFQVKKKQFFRNFMTIMLFGALGTLISFIIISLGSIFFFRKLDVDLAIGDYLAIGAIFAATDSVCTLQAGLLSAYIIKKLYFGSHSTDREVSIMMLMAYLSYMLAELFYLSGILTVFFCGIVMSHYTWHNVTENSRVTTKHTFATLSFVAEIFIFLYVGMDALDIEKWRVVSNSPKTSVSVSATLLGLTMVGRAAFVFPLSFLSNLTKKSPDERIDFKQQITIWWAGLMRGAVSMALAYNQFTRAGYTQLRGNAIFITSTITVVLFSTVVFGLMTKPLVRLLMPSTKQLTRTVSSEPGTPKSLIIPLLGESQDSEADLFIGNRKASESHQGGKTLLHPSSLKMLLTTPTRTVHYYWRKFDNAFMRPVFGGRGFVPYVPGSPIEQSIHLLQGEE
ncbi:sodium/hydrogen exchanger 2-like isoform X2 [Henckelia pumila]|uniref:sodium/hydrogen exchanger 2-like isoform X2 n=1 Tax=Henckelia pumila TaxID=405737 RepID=UPI003C6DEE13